MPNWVGLGRGSQKVTVALPCHAQQHELRNNPATTVMWTRAKVCEGKALVPGYMGISQPSIDYTRK